VLHDFKLALARAHTDYGFYIDCLTTPGSALAGYDLSPHERSTLTDPGKLAEVLMRGVGEPKLLPSITIKISGTHDWVNRAAPKKREAMQEAERDARIAAEVEAIRRAGTDDERTCAVVRLMELVG
jgi:hypothetical protein